MNQVIPIFKTDSSFGKSILTDAHPKKVKEGGPNSVFKIAKDNNLTQVFLIEDSFVSFYDAHRITKELGIQLIYGVYFKVLDEVNKNHFSKVAIVAKNDNGAKTLRSIYSHVHTSKNEEGKPLGKIDPDYLYKIVKENPDDIKLCVPFYDSFIHWNMTNFEVVVMDFEGLDVTFFIEDKGLPFDSSIKKKVLSYCKNNNHKTQNVHTIYYENNSDAKSLQVYKMICNRSYSGKKASLGNPNLEGFCSDRFSFEDFKKKINE